MQKTEFLTIYPTFENFKIVKKTLPSVLEESMNNNSKVIVHDSSVREKEQKRKYLEGLRSKYDFLLLLSDNISAAHSRNMCLSLGMDLYAPDYTCLLEDDHGYREGTIDALIKAMKEYYGKRSPNGLMYGIFTTCYTHTHASIKKIKGNLGYPLIEENADPFTVGGTNNCFRCAPTSHWINVLKFYDTDEYLLSTFQTSQPRWRNYHKGFTAMYVGNRKLEYFVETRGRGMTSKDSKKIWDDCYAASDSRSGNINNK